MKKFALIGAAGYIAPRHMQAIKFTGNHLVAAMDPSDSVGIIDSFFPDSSFFTEFERFDRHIDKIQRGSADEVLDFTTICSPNYLHDSHIRFALRSGTEAICEKPLVLNPWNIDALLRIEEGTGKKVNTILQLRLHPSILALRDQMANRKTGSKVDVDLLYITSRGKWYMHSWKGDEKKSGGIATNIGVHFFDMLHFLFGDLQQNKVHLNERNRAGGYLEYENARVRWFLSIDASDLPKSVQASGQRTFRSIEIDGEELEFSDGFSDLHRLSYERILNGCGFGLESNRSAIETVSQIRNSRVVELSGEYHPILKGLAS
jgi:UDP-N-acetyl-2-amino-2-deoxyglucuronate dehydrogenase